MFLVSLAACTDGDPGSGPDKADETGRVCVQPAVHPNTVMARLLGDQPGAVADGAVVINNYTAWPAYDPGASTAPLDSGAVATIDDRDEARANLASRFGNCAPDIEDHIAEAKPNVYIYFTGFGGADQNNSLVGQGAILKWFNDRDPNALIFSINWNCAGSADPWCGDNTDALAAKDSDPHVESMVRAIDVIVPQIASDEVAAQVRGVVDQLSQQQRGYDSALSHSMWLAARLIDQLLVAEVGDIRIAGYSMGAHAAARLLIQDFSDGPEVGFEWSRNACSDGGNHCTVAELGQVEWSMAMGLSGWSHALQTENRANRDQFENGGLFRAGDAAYGGKLVVLNRRMDPTSNADDTFQRGFNDILFGDYNHYSHDYTLPLFVQSPFLRALDAYVESSSSTGSAEMGIYYDNAGLVDFDDCPDSGSCEAGTGYLAHEINRSHAKNDIPRVSVDTVDGVPHAQSDNNRAATFASAGTEPIALRSFDQEDLRGGVEMYFRPQFGVSEAGLHGLFSYGSCQGSDDDLMPSARIEDGALVFEMTYQDELFRAEVDAASAGLADGKWTHLAFTWELPVESLTVPHESAGDLAAALPGMIADLTEHQVALVLATGLRKPSATSYKRQSGAGTMKIFVNGTPAAESVLGRADSARECLRAADVLSEHRYDVNGESYPAFGKYARYDVATGDIVAFSPQQVVGTKCKAYRVRNDNVFFGCSKSDTANAGGDMDDIVLVWGPGRESYDNVGSDGAPALWPLGVDYDSQPLRIGAE